MKDKHKRGIHRLYGNGETVPPPPSLVIEGRISTAVKPKPNVVILTRETYHEQDGGRFMGIPGGELVEIPKDRDVVFVGEKVDESKMDMVVMVEGLYAEPSVLMPDGRTKAVVLALTELARVDFGEFVKRAKAGLAGVQGVPGFVEHPETWTQPPPTPEPLSQS